MAWEDSYNWHERMMTWILVIVGVYLLLQVIIQLVALYRGLQSDVGT